MTTITTTLWKRRSERSDYAETREAERLEKVLIDYLNTQGVLSVPAYVERPPQLPEKFVVIERTGGREEDHIRYATIAVQSVAQTLYDTVQLNEEVLEAMEGAEELDEIGSVRLSSFYNFTGGYSADRNEHRYQAIFEIAHY